MKTFNFILLGMAVLYTLLLTIFSGDAVDYLQNIVMYLIPIGGLLGISIKYNQEVTQCTRIPLI